MTRQSDSLPLTVEVVDKRMLHERIAACEENVSQRQRSFRVKDCSISVNKCYCFYRVVWVE